MGRHGEAAPPMSLEALRQKVLLSCHTANREAAAFSSHLAPHTHIHTDLWIPTLQVLLKPLRKTVQDVDLEELEPILKAAARKQRKTKEAGLGDGESPEEDQQQEVEEITQMCEIAREFDLLVPGVLKQLEEAHREQLRKFCISFEAEGRGLDIPTLREYENRIIRWDGQIEARLVAADRAVAAVNELRRSLILYIEQYEQVVKHMAEVAELLIKVCIPMKRWVSADAAYSSKVQLAINELNQRRFAAREQLKAMELQREQVALRLRRGAWSISGLGEQLNVTRRDRQNLRAAESRLQVDEARVAARASKADAAAARLRKWPPPSRDGMSGSRTSSNELLAAQLEAARTDMRKVEAERGRIRTQLAGVRREQVDVQRRLEKDVGDLKSLSDHQEAATTRREQLDQMLQVQRGELQQMEEQLAALKRVRKVKDRADTVRRIHRLGHVPSDVTEPQDPLQEAIHLAAADVGHEWPTLYARLHFRPPRQDADRRRDIIEIEETPQQLPDYSGRRRAIRGLKLWRRLSQSASLLDLTTALRNMRRHGTIKKIEERLLTTR